MIEKELKDYRWVYDEELKRLAIIDAVNHERVVMDKVRMLSLARFIIRVLARLSVHKRHEHNK
jgi:hypothetical protein